MGLLPAWRERTSPISAVDVAARLQDAREMRLPELLRKMRENPRIEELLWFIQWVSHQPGGLEKFAHDLIIRFPERVGLKGIQVVGFPLGRKYSVAEFAQIWAATVDKHDLLGYRDYLSDLCLQGAEKNATADQMADFLRFERILISPAKGLPPGDLRFLQSRLEGLTPEYYWLEGASRVLSALPGFMVVICTGDWDGGLEFSDFQGLGDALFSAMDEHAAEVACSTAETSVRREIFEELDYGLSQRRSVRIFGDSRYGKTAAVETWCGMRPGMARIVTVQDGNREWDFLAEHAKALGIPFNLHTTLNALKRDVEFVVQNGRLFLVYDEAHFLFPANCTKGMVPKRLNWVRHHVIDKRVGCALFATRQSFNQSMDEFVKVTRYNMDQFLGRISGTLVLRQVHDREDLAAIARLRFPKLDEDYILYIVSIAGVSEGSPATIEDIASRAFFNAGKGGRSNVTLGDIHAACERLGLKLPEAQAAKPVENILRGDGNGLANSVKAPGIPRGFQQKDDFEAESGTGGLDGFTNKRAAGMSSNKPDSRALVGCAAV